MVQGCDTVKNASPAKAGARPSSAQQADKRIPAFAGKAIRWRFYQGRVGRPAGGQLAIAPESPSPAGTRRIGPQSVRPPRSCRRSSRDWRHTATGVIVFTSIAGIEKFSSGPASPGFWTNTKHPRFDYDTTRGVLADRVTASVAAAPNSPLSSPPAGESSGGSPTRQF
jgi:hypothetical protein